MITSRNQVRIRVNNPPNYQEINSKVKLFQVLKKMIIGRMMEEFSRIKSQLNTLYSGAESDYRNVRTCEP